MASNVSRVKKTILTLFQASVTLVILFFVFRDPTKRAAMVHDIRNADPMWLVAGFVAYGLVELVCALRWYLLLRVQGINLSPIRMGMLMLIGVFFNYLIPGGAGGDVVKIFYLLKETPGKSSAAVLSVLVDRLIGLMGLVVMSAVLIMTRWSWITSTPQTSKAVWATLIILGSAVSGVMFTIIVGKYNLIHKLPAKMPGRDRLAEIALAYNLFGRQWGSTLAALFLSLVAHVGYFAVFYCPALSFHASKVTIPSFVEFCAIMPVVNTIASMPISIGGVGVREGLFQVFLGQLCGVSDHVAVVMSSVGYLLTMAWGLVGAVIYAFYRPSEHAAMSEMNREVAGMEHQVAEEEIALETADSEEK